MIDIPFGKLRVNFCAGIQGLGDKRGWNIVDLIGTYGINVSEYNLASFDSGLQREAGGPQAVFGNSFPFASASPDPIYRNERVVVAFFHPAFKAKFLRRKREN